MAAKVLACGGAAKKVCALLNEHGYAAHAVREYEAERAEGMDAVILLPPVAEGGTVSAAEALVRQGVAVLCVGAEPPEGSGAVFLKNPVSSAMLLQTLALALEMRARLRALEGENERLKAALSDFKLIDRAKCALIQYLGMTEKDAHRFIEKQAMDRRVPRREIALDILKTYEP